MGIPQLEQVKLAQGSPLLWGIVLPQPGQTQLPPRPNPNPPILPLPFPWPILFPDPKPPPGGPAPSPLGISLTSTFLKILNRLLQCIHSQFGAVNM